MRAYTYSLSLPAWTTGHVLTSMKESVPVSEVGKGWGADERQPCLVISEVMRLKMTWRLGGLGFCAAC